MVQTVPPTCTLRSPRKHLHLKKRDSSETALTSSKYCSYSIFHDLFGFQCIYDNMSPFSIMSSNGCNAWRRTEEAQFVLGLPNSNQSGHLAVQFEKRAHTYPHSIDCSPKRVGALSASKPDYAFLLHSLRKTYAGRNVAFVAIMDFFLFIREGK